MEEAKHDIYAGVGRRVKEKRVALGLTLDDLAAASGVSRRMIVNVEQGAVNASIGTLLRLSDALGIGLPSLVAPERMDTVSLTREGNGAALWRGAHGGQGVLLAGTAPPDVLELWEWTLAPGDRHESEAHRIGTREIAHVREGSLNIETSGRVDELRAGDALAFQSDVDHAYANPGDVWTRFTLTVFEPNVRDARGAAGE